jgi:hypothetical protein
MRTSSAVAALALVASLVPTTGCYFGRSKEAKRGAYVANGALIAAAGVALAAAALDSDDGCEGDGCAWNALGKGYATMAIAGLLGGGGILGIGINLLVPTKDAPKPAPPVAPTVTSYEVTAPGLAPAVVQLR